MFDSRLRSRIKWCVCSYLQEGQGLGKKEQGMSVALQVEKTSKRGGRIIHEKEIMPPPSLDYLPKINSPAAPPAPTSPPFDLGSQKDEPKVETGSITELMKEPSKVVLLKVLSLIRYARNCLQCKIVRRD